MGDGRRALRILVHAQHLSGIGHWVRSHAIAQALATRHTVWLTDGGRPVPTAPAPGVHLLRLPRLHRGAHGLAPLERGARLPAVLAARRRLLVQAVAALRPDVVVVEHYPFSKWELETEILATIRATRAAAPGARIVCSLRDIAPQTAQERLAPECHARRVLDRLRHHFDALLVHADPALARLEEHFPAAARIPVPVICTGLVAKPPGARPSAAARATRRAATGGAPYVLVTVGGGAGDPRFPRLCLAAWARVRRTAALRGHRLVVLAGLAWSPRRRAALARAGGPGVAVQAFVPDVRPWLRGATLVVAHAGYNTATDVLATRARAVLAANPRMSDQPARAQRLAALGLVDTPDPVRRPLDALVQAMRRALGRPRRRAAVDLDGAAATRRAIEALAAGVSRRARSSARA